MLIRYQLLPYIDGGLIASQIIGIIDFVTQGQSRFSGEASWYEVSNRLE